MALSNMCKKVNILKPLSCQHRFAKMAAIMAFRGMNRHVLQAARGMCTGMWLSDPSCRAVRLECAQQGATAPVRQPWKTKVAPQHQQAVSGLQLPLRRCFGSELDTEAHQGTSETLSERDFHRHADLTMGQLLGSLEDVVESHEVADSDVELGQGVLTCSLGDLGTYVYNKQAPNKQMWASSPVSGPNRYDWNDGKWLCRRDGHELISRLQKELRQLLKDDSIDIEPEPVVGYGPDPT